MGFIGSSVYGKIEGGKRNGGTDKTVAVNPEPKKHWPEQVGVGDIVLVRSPENPRKVMAKRLMGMVGDSVTHVVDPKNNDWCETVVVPKGHVWIEGDNMYDPKDSRYFGAVPYGLLQGKGLCGSCVLFAFRVQIDTDNEVESV
ncbi:mitochondrial inner membrane protease subunit 1-like [Cucurbita pepo subsp. pepo]|uniref:mitochondrial inner membrane protease subunit 1-like n=1 Tax=Cucurbita pepo subsp. pepo TaxID=3664 RepID=UPI000C9D467D|nr:mitochondrial inner membrane protease subunit 1-like [Cucurbita pepo subsp. pepo]